MLWFDLSKHRKNGRYHVMVLTEGSSAKWQEIASCDAPGTACLIARHFAEAVYSTIPGVIEIHNTGNPASKAW